MITIDNGECANQNSLSHWFTAARAESKIDKIGARNSANDSPFHLLPVSNHCCGATTNLFKKAK